MGHRNWNGVKQRTKPAKRASQEGSCCFHWAGTSSTPSCMLTMSHLTIPLCPSDLLLPLILCSYSKRMHLESVPGKERYFRFLKQAGKLWQQHTLGIQSTRSSTTDRRIINPLFSLKKYCRYEIMKFYTIYEILSFPDNPETQLSVC